ncbi:MAG: hypothetical protein ACYDAN_14795 [Candidatus Limnocylindrales bacterium]
MSSLVRRLAAMSDARVFAIAGGGGRWGVQDLRLADGIELVASPRAASVLLVAGAIGSRQHEAVRRVHDALPHPRATIRWGEANGGQPVPDAELVPAGSDPVPAIRAAHRALMLGARTSEAALLPDEEPAAWRGVGPYGQGGSGMTGGTPYGRPMAELGPDRDGLRLDVLPTRLGPFFAAMVHGLELDLRVAGDVVVGAEVAAAAVAPTAGGAASPFVRALIEPMPIADLEVARARDHLRWTAEALRLHGLEALSRRALLLARTAAPGQGPAVRALGAAVARAGVFRWAVPPADERRRDLLAHASLGPSTRACGFPVDERLADPAYQGLGFSPILGVDGGVAAVWRARLDEAAMSLDLAARAGGATTAVTGSVEGPRGRLSTGDAPAGRALGLVPALIEGLEWGDALSTLASLDIDLDEMASVQLAFA